MNLTATFEVLGPLMLSFSNILNKMCHKVKVSTDHLLKIGKLKPLLFGTFYAKYSKTQHEGPLDLKHYRQIHSITLYYVH